MIKKAKRSIGSLTRRDSFHFYFILLIFLFVPQTLSAKAYQVTIKAKAIEKNLHEDRAWLALTHYRRQSFSTSYRSEADHSSFLFSLDGSNDPKSELLATIEAMFLPQKLGDEHPQCIFPARFAWLRKTLGIDPSELPAIKCEALQAWREQLAINQVTLVFPTSYLNNPSSMFGHAFLRFESLDRSENKLLMAPTINFAADTSAQKGVVDYILRGLLGGFPSKNSIQPFYEKFKRYADIESRDIWEYPLNYTQDELDLLILHVWELRGNVFDYFFLDENCVYRLLALLEVGRPDLRLIESFKAYTIPSDVIRALRERGLIQSRNYRASAVKTFSNHLKRLSKDEKQITIDIVRNQLALDSDRVLTLPIKRRVLVLALASEYLDILINKDILDRKLSAQLTHQLFVERSKYSAPVAWEKLNCPKVSPDEGHKTQRISITGGFDKNDTFYTIGYRGAYHGITDPLPGFEKGAEVELLNVELRGYENDDIRLDKLDVINVKSLTPFDNFFTPASWRFSIGRERKELHDKYPLLTDIEGGMGVTFAISDLMLTGLLHLELDFGSALDKSYGIGSGLYLNIVHQSERLSCDFGGLFMKYLLGDYESLTKLWGIISFPIDRNNAIFSKIKYFPNNRNGFYEVSLGLHHYF